MRLDHTESDDVESAGWDPLTDVEATSRPPSLLFSFLLYICCRSTGAELPLSISATLQPI